MTIAFPIAIILVVAAAPSKGAPVAPPSDPFTEWVPPEVVKGFGDAKTAQNDLAAAPAGSDQQAAAQKKLDQSVQRITDAGTKYSDNFPAQKSVVRALDKLGDYDKAKPFADHAVELADANGDPRLRTQALLLRGDVHLGLKDYGGALKDSEAVLKLDPRNKTALALRSQAAGRAGTDGSKASPAPGAIAASGAGPNAAAPNRGAAVSGPGTFGASDAAKAAGAVTTTEARRKSDALAREAAQRVSIDPAAARDLAEKAVGLDPRNARAYFARAAARRAAGDLMGAMEDLDRTLAAEPAFTEAHAVKAAVGMALGRSAEEIKAEFLASGRAPADFADYYRDQLAALGGGRKGGSGGASAPDRSWTVASLPARARENAGTLLAVGLGLALFGLALRHQTRKRMGDEG